MDVCSRGRRAKRGVGRMGCRDLGISVSWISRRDVTDGLQSMARSQIARLISVK